MKSGSAALGAIDLNELAEDVKTLSRVWELCGGLVKRIG